MFEFGRELKRILGGAVTRDEADLSLLELLDTEQLEHQAKTCNVNAGRVSTRDPYPHWLAASAVWREQARRTGDPVALRKAASAAVSAISCAHNEAARARAALDQALASLTGADLFGDPALLDAAREILRSIADVQGDSLFEARLEAAWARIASREALARDDDARAMEAAALFDSAIHHLRQASRDHSSPAVRLEAAAAQIEREDLLAGFGVRRHDTRLIENAVAGLETLLASLDALYEPLSWARCAEVLGAAKVSLGETEGRVERIAEGVSLLALIEETVNADQAPLDWVRVQHALGLGLQALGETCDQDQAFDQAEAAFTRAVERIGASPVTLRATVANNRASCLARSAELRGDMVALGRAEAAFKIELQATEAAADPVSWAVLQLNLSRLYETRADLLGQFAQREAAVYALEEAFEVFCDHGMKSLADQASAALERVRGAG